MLAEQSQIISLTQLAAVAGCSRDHITQLYLHWTAGRYGQVYDDYHLNIDADGTVYRTSSLSQYKSHTWRHNSGSIAVALCYGPYSGDAETRWDLWYMRDSPGDGQMKPGGDILRGKARWYLEHSKI